jgi:hypothetical protein
MSGAAVEDATIEDVIREFDRSTGLVMLQEKIDAPTLRVLCVGGEAIALRSGTSAGGVDDALTTALAIHATVGLDIGQIDLALSDPPRALSCFQPFPPLGAASIGEHATRAVSALAALAAAAAHGA